ncbi:unnamed protein product [Phaedon cochleariae]|uniref:PHD-type domain-containing protein n=1 Tax=Phaedon cochleariae TaxID=80249 RepID=A0A9P0DK98_PHACE|nr:unnamed protein product [Phaedon cochleariae]
MIMTPLNEIDSHFVKCVGYLHGSSTLRRGDPVPLQYVLEEAIKNKYGIVKDYTDLVQSCLKPREEKYTTITHYEESKGSNSDNELELDLLKEDLMCVICNGMDVGARNRLIECTDCHSLYHQECHKPMVTEDVFENWACFNCKEASKKLRIASSGSSSMVSSSSSKSSSHRHSSSSSGSSYKSSSYSRVAEI